MTNKRADEIIRKWEKENPVPEGLSLDAHTAKFGKDGKKAYAIYLEQRHLLIKGVDKIVKEYSK